MILRQTAKFAYTKKLEPAADDSRGRERHHTNRPWSDCKMAKYRSEGAASSVPVDLQVDGCERVCNLPERCALGLFFIVFYLEFSPEFF